MRCTYMHSPCFHQYVSMVEIPFAYMPPRQWPEVSDFVTRFCKLHESENTRPCENRTRFENCTRFACKNRMAVCFLTRSTCKNVWHKSYTLGHCLMPPKSNCFPILFQYYMVHLCAKFGDLKLIINKTAMSLSLARAPLFVVELGK